MCSMEKKTTTSFNIDKAISRIAKPSIFDRLVKEVDARKIPAKYIEQILVQYHDGSIVELKGKDISHPIPINRNIAWNEMESAYKKMRDVKVFISTEQLESDVNVLVEDYLGK